MINDFRSDFKLVDFRMELFRLIIFLFYLTGNFAYGQQVHTKTAWVYETDSIPKKQEEITYHPDGTVFTHLQKGGTLATYFYDESGRETGHSSVNALRESHCKLAFVGRQQIMFCYEPMDSGGIYFTEHTDSLSADSLVLLTRHRQGTTVNGDTTLNGVNTTRYTYDRFGYKISEIRTNKDGIIFHWEKSSRNFHRDTVITRTGAGSNDRCLDSSVTCYRGGQITDIYVFQFRRANGYAVTTHIEINYDTKFHPFTDNEMNSKIIRENFPYINPGIRLNPGNFPSEINVTINDIDHRDKKGNSDYTYYYNYDDTGRLINITGTGIKPYGETINADIDISYVDEEASLVNHYMINYAGSRVSAKTELYMGTELVEWSENTEWGFPLRTTKYVYTYYE